MAGVDPFDEVKVEVEAAVVELARNRGWPTSKVKETVEQIEFDLGMLDESIERVTVNPGKYGLTSGEVESRRAFVRGVRQKMAAYRPSANHRSGLSQGDQRSQLLGSSQDRVAQQAAQAALREENDDFIGGEQLKRALIEREQDEVLDDLGESVTRLGQMGLSIHTELKEQEAILDDLENRTDYAVHNMDDVNRLVKDMIKSKEGRNQLWLICLLTSGLVVVTSLIFLL